MELSFSGSRRNLSTCSTAVGVRAGWKGAAAARRFAKRPVKSLPVLWVVFADHPPVLQRYVAKNQPTSTLKLPILLL